VRDERARNMLIADATLARGVISLRETPSDATGALQEVVDEYRSSNYGRGLPSAYVLLAQAQVGARRFDAANAAFDSAMSVMERQRASLLDRDQRTEFLDNARDVIDRIIRFHADRGDARGAFDFFERTRSRVLLERLTTSAGSTAAAAPRFATASDVMAWLGAQDVVVGYAVLRDELLVWRLSRAGIDLHRVPVSASELALRVGALRSSMIDPTAASNFAKASEQLYRLLVVPLGALAAEARLTIIPDRSLHFVPFAALRDSSGRFLVQDHEIAYAPSATLATRLGRTTSSVSGHTTRILAIANPSFDTSAFPLPPLPGAEREARAIASLYRRASVLVGSRATDTELASIAPTFGIVHFAGHALVRPDAPGLSHLVLASDGTSDGAIFAGEIASWNLRRTELVVLSGCSTSDGRLSATEGASSLARAFFAAGVRSVIASLWAIEDAPTADFFAAFHRRLARGEGAGAALRATQIEWLGDASPRSPAVWAAFQLFSQ
jgi:CHAT domain-containing protein